MDKVPGPLLYKITSYTGGKSILTIETLSKTLQSKLLSNLSAFQGTISKVYRPEA
jgi:hypothetical protein